MIIQVEVNGQWYTTDKSSFIADVQRGRIGRNACVQVGQWVGRAGEIKGLQFPDNQPPPCTYTYTYQAPGNYAQETPPPFPSGNTTAVPMNSGKSSSGGVWGTLGVIVGVVLVFVLIGAFKSGPSSSSNSPSYSASDSYDDFDSDSSSYSSSPQVHYGENEVGGGYVGVTEGDAGFGVATDGYGNGYVGATDGNGAGFFGVTDGNAGVGVATDSAGNSSLIITDQYGNTGVFPVE